MTHQILILTTKTDVIQKHSIVMDLVEAEQNFTVKTLKVLILLSRMLVPVGQMLTLTAETKYGKLETLTTITMLKYLDLILERILLTHG